MFAALLKQLCNAQQNSVTTRFTDEDQNQELPEGESKHTGNKGKGIANKWGPGHKERPLTEALKPAMTTLQRFRFEREPATILILHQESAQNVIHHRP